MAGRGRHSPQYLACSFARGGVVVGSVATGGLSTMADPDERDALEVQVDHWRSYLQRRRPGYRRGLPSGRQAPGRAGRALSGVRTRAFRAALETVGRGPGGEGTRVVRSCDLWGRRRVLRPKLQSLRLSAPDRLLRLEASAERGHVRLACRDVRGRRGVRQRLPIHARGLHGDAHGAAFTDRIVAGRGHRLRRGPLDGWRRPNGLRPLLR